MGLTLNLIEIKFNLSSEEKLGQGKGTFKERSKSLSWSQTCQH